MNKILKTIKNKYIKIKSNRMLLINSKYKNIKIKYNILKIKLKSKYKNIKIKY